MNIHDTPAPKKPIPNIKPRKADLLGLLFIVIIKSIAIDIKARKLRLNGAKEKTKAPPASREMKSMVLGYLLY